MIMNKHIETCGDENDPITNGMEISFFRKNHPIYLKSFRIKKEYETGVST